MAIPTFSSITPDAGPSGGRSTALITGTGFRVSATNGLTVEVQFDGVPARLERTHVLSDTEIRVEVPAYARKGSAALQAALPAVDVRIANLDDNGGEIAGENVTVAEVYTYQRAPVRAPSTTEENQHYRRVIVEMLNNFHRQVLVNTTIGTSVDYGEAGAVTIVASRLPAIGINGPRMSENFDVRHQWLDLPSEELSDDPGMFQDRWHGYTVDMEFDYVITANKRRELYALVHAVNEMFLRTPFLELREDPQDSNSELHQFPFVLTSAPNVSTEDANSDLLTAVGRFEVRWVPIRLTQGFTIEPEILEGGLLVGPLGGDPADEESVPFANEDE